MAAPSTSAERLVQNITLYPLAVTLGNVLPDSKSKVDCKSCKLNKKGMSV